MDSQLLFVNKTQSSAHLSRSGGGEKARILSHVQSKRRRAQAKTKSQQWTKYTSIMTATTTAMGSEQGGDELVSKSDTSTSPEVELFTLPWTYPTHNGSDPFYCTAVHTDAGAHSVLKFTFSYASRANFIAEAFAPLSVCLQRSRMRHDDIFDARLRRCVEDETLMYATLAYGSSLLDWMMNKFDAHFRPEYYLGKALSSVRVRLRDPKHVVDDWLLLSVYGLAVTEMWNGQPLMWKGHPQRYAMVIKTSQYAFAACRTHLQIMIAMVARAGGWEGFDPYVLDSAILADKYLAVSSMQSPVIPLTWDPGSLPDKTRRRLGVKSEALPHLGRRLLNISMSEKLKGIIYDLIEHCRIAHESWSTNVGSDVESWLFRRLQAITYRLLFVYNDHHTGYVDRCISISTTIFILSATPSKGPQISVVSAAEQLAALLTNGGLKAPEGEILEGELRFWCLCSAVMVPEPSNGDDRILSQLSLFIDGEIVARELGERLQLFMFLPASQEGQLASLVRKLRRHKLLLQQNVV